MPARLNALDGDVKMKHLSFISSDNIEINVGLLPLNNSSL